MAKRKTNTQLIQSFLKNTHPVMHALVVSQLTSQAEKVLADKDAVRAELKNSIIHPDLWIQFNEEVMKHLEQK